MSKKTNKKAVKIISIILAAVIVLTAGFTVISHTVWHRSDMATLAELYLRISGSKDKYAIPKKNAEYIAKRANAKEYTLNPSGLQSAVSEESVNGNKMYKLTKSEKSDYIILYLHGGAYINDALVYHWKLCDKLTQELNAEVIVPIYPLAPQSTYKETFDMLTRLYADILDDADVPITMMGDSAGGGLTVAFCEYLNEIGLRQPDNMILLSPWLDISMSNSAMAELEKSDPMLSADGLVEIGKLWAGELPLDDYRISPIFGDFSALKNITMFVGTREILYPDITQFYAMLQREGIPSTLYIGEGLNHDYPLFPIPEAKTAFEQICDAVKEVDK